MSNTDRLERDARETPQHRDSHHIAGQLNQMSLTERMSVLTKMERGKGGANLPETVIEGIAEHSKHEKQAEKGHAYRADGARHQRTEASIDFSQQADVYRGHATDGGHHTVSHPPKEHKPGSPDRLDGRATPEKEKFEIPEELDKGFGGLHRLYFDYEKVPAEALDKAEKHFKQGQKTHDYTQLVKDMDDAQANMTKQDYDQYRQRLDERLHKAGLKENLHIASIDGVLNIDDSSTGSSRISGGRFSQYDDPMAAGQR